MSEAEIAFLRLTVEKLRRALFGTRSERKRRLLDQLELQLDKLEASATEDELAAERAASETTRVKGSAAAVPRAPAARAGGGSAADMLRELRLGEAVEDRRGRDRDAGGDPAPVEGDADGAREVHLPGLREDQPAAGAVPCDAAGLGGPEPAGNDRLREVRTASAAEPPARPLRARGGSISAPRRWPTRWARARWR